MTILITAFDPFGGERLNASWEAAQALRGRRIGGAPVIVAQLPTVFGASLAQLDAQIAQHRPALVICLGQAARRSAISFERVAINLDDARIADNAGAQPVDRPVVEGGPAAYFSRLPLKAMLAAAQAAGAPAELSHSAGTFVCNHLFYGLMHRIATRPALAGLRGGFIHVPSLPEQALPGAPALALADTVRGLDRAIAVALAQREDLAVPGGAID